MAGQSLPNISHSHGDLANAYVSMEGISAFMTCQGSYYSTQKRPYRAGGAVLRALPVWRDGVTRKGSSDGGGWAKLRVTARLNTNKLCEKQQSTTFYKAYLCFTASAAAVKSIFFFLPSNSFCQVSKIKMRLRFHPS